MKEIDHRSGEQRVQAIGGDLCGKFEIHGVYFYIFVEKILLKTRLKYISHHVETIAKKEDYSGGLID